MASSPKLISILFLFALFSMQIHAREFFSKIPSVNNNEKETTTIPDTREQQHESFIPATTHKTSLPNREEQTTFGKQEQEPRFIPETQNGYGLYGHESGQLPPSTTTKETYEPYVTPVRYHPDEPYNSIPASNNNNNKNTYYYNKNAYESTEQQNLGGARFTEKGWSTKENQNNNYYYGNNGYNNNKNTYYYNKNAYESTEQQNLGEARFTEKGWSTKENQNNNYYYGNNGYNNGEKQGMSDTRYLENGKYYHDIKSENNNYPNQFENSRGGASRNEFNENRYNNMGRYNQNQEEFEENEEEFEP
ncbi:protein E6-like [Durio zibethinus]|uniref:Protein E6-like n=1 Tax=Durio zibethinus TaxID=66656 RepID=A0A6P6BJV0_DURZI|nr:protein E6-like [Durio zibethinus]